MWTDSYLEESLIREHMAEVQRQVAANRLLQHAKPRRGIWRQLARLFWIVLALAGCGVSTPVTDPSVTGRRVQGATIAAAATLPYRVGAYELVFADVTGTRPQPRRAALLVDLIGGNGHARGFVEWGRAGAVTDIYVADGWARQRASAGELVTVFELALNHREAQPTVVLAGDRGYAPPVAIRVVVNEASGDVTLTARR